MANCFRISVWSDGAKNMLHSNKSWVRIDPMDTVREALAAIRALIEPPERWTTGRNARDHDGNGVPPTWHGAVCWCVDGAACKVCPGQGYLFPDKYDTSILRYVREALDAVAIDLYPGEHHNSVTVNDTLGHAAVLRMLDHAIAAQGVS